MFKKLLDVLSKNLGYTIVLIVSVVLFAVFSKGLLSGLIAAVSALLAYTCAVALYKEYKKQGTKKTVPVKKQKKTTVKK